MSTKTLNKITKGLFIFSGAVFALIILVKVFGDKPVSEQTDADKWQNFKHMNDCELALKIFSDYRPIMNDWATVLETSKTLTYQQAVNWKKSNNFDKRLDEVANKYPAVYPLNLPNAKLASGIEFRIGQWWRDIFSNLRKSNNQDRGSSDQVVLISQEFSELKKQCPNEFK